MLWMLYRSATIAGSCFKSIKLPWDFLARFSGVSRYSRKLQDATASRSRGAVGKRILGAAAAVRRWIGVSSAEAIRKFRRFVGMLKVYAVATLPEKLRSRHFREVPRLLPYDWNMSKKLTCVTLMLL